LQGGSYKEAVTAALKEPAEFGWDAKEMPWTSVLTEGRVG
jgi:hypothetical protein